MTLSAYEEERNRTIAENRKKLAELGLLNLPQLGATTPLPQPKIRKLVQQKRPAAVAELRPKRVLRTRIDAASQLDHVELDADDFQPRRAPGSVRRGSVRRLAADCDAAAEEEDEVAVELPDGAEVEDEGDTAPKRGGCAYVKHMMPSLVTGGYWAQAPTQLCSAMPQGTYGIHLRVGNVLWPVTWLQRPSGAGLSGGWRGFAVDQRLCVGDAVVFQLRDGSKRVLDVHIFRAHLLEGERHALDAAFDLAEALSSVEEGQELPKPSPTVRPALHWHSARAKMQRCVLPHSVGHAATRRVGCSEFECEMHARRALAPIETIATAEAAKAELLVEAATETKELAVAEADAAKAAPHVSSEALEAAIANARSLSAIDKEEEVFSLIQGKPRTVIVKAELFPREELPTGMRGWYTTIDKARMHRPKAARSATKLKDKPLVPELQLYMYGEWFNRKIIEYLVPL